MKALVKSVVLIFLVWDHSITLTKTLGLLKRKALSVNLESVNLKELTKRINLKEFNEKD